MGYNGEFNAVNWLEETKEKHKATGQNIRYEFHKQNLDMGYLDTSQCGHTW